MHDVHEDEHRDQDEEEGPDVVGAPLERRLEGPLHVANVEEVGEDEILAAPESIVSDAVITRMLSTFLGMLGFRVKGEITGVSSTLTL